MINPPRTKEEARKRNYGHGKLKLPFYGDRCAYAVGGDPVRVFNQCSRRPGHGPGELYCKQHARMVEEG